MPDADPAASVLDEIRANANGAITDSGEDCTDVRTSCLGHNTLRAADALEAALKRHQPVKYGVAAVCGRCRASWPCPEVADITAALAAKEAGNA